MCAVELDQENTIRVQRTEWQALNEDSTRCSELEAENSRLAVDLERCQSAIGRVEELEQDNKRLQRELTTALEEKQQNLETFVKAKLFNKPSPSPGEPAPFSVQRIKHNGAATVSGEEYEVLVKKHNLIYNQWKFHKGKHEEHAALNEKNRENVAQWKQAVENLNTQNAKKESRIKKLKEEIDRLKSGSVTGAESSKDDITLPIPSSSIAAKEKPWLGAVAAMALNTDVPAPKSSMLNDDTAAHADGKKNHDSPDFAPRPDAESEETPDLLLDLEEELGITKHIAHKSMIIHDSQAEDEEEDIEAELSLPKLPRLSENPELSEHHHSDTTDEENGPMTAKQNNQDIAVKVASSSSPVMVSTKRVKKRKSLHEVNTPVVKVKLELGSSSPAQRTHSSDSLDLDDIGEKVATPRKQRRLMDLSKNLQAISQGNRSRVQSQLREGSEQVFQETPVRRVGTSRTGSVLQPLSVNKQVLTKPSDMRDPKRRRIADDNAIGALTEDGANLLPLGTRKDAERDERLANLLDKPSPEKQVLSPVRSVVSAKRPRDLLARSALVIHRDVARSEESELPRPGQLAIPFEQSRPVSAPSSRVSRKSQERSRPSSKESTEPQRPNFKGFSKTSTTTQRQVSRDAPRSYNTPPFVLPKSRTSESAFRKTESAKTTPVQTFNTSSKSTDRRRHARTKQTAAEWENDPEQEPLRIRPVQTLRLEDFKINPDYNQGYKHAFSEVVRDREQRQALHACVKPGCCGEKFRALAMAGRNFDVKRTGAEKIADDQMMREFLGDNAYKLERMSKSEKDALWIQARTRQLAQQHGRHRNAYERQPTPPGFWQADFPTTQEQIEQREKAEEAVRLNVQQRYEEAMRRGAYIFADE